MHEQAKEFAEHLVKHVRDASIASCDGDLDKTANRLVAKRWRAASNRGDSAALIEMLIADCVDTTIFYFLHAIDNGMFQAGFKGCDLGKDGRGELGGWYMASWREELSRERSFDDFKNS